MAVELKKGVNYVSWPWPTMSCEDAFGEAAEFVDAVWYYDETAGRWLMYSPTAPPYANDLYNVVEGETYAFRMGRDCLMEYEAGRIVFTAVARPFPWQWLLIPVGGAGALAVYLAVRKRRR